MSETESEKYYYTIGEVARMFEVNASLIRFWEDEFNFIKPSRNKKGNRLFTKVDIDHFHLIFHLTREKGMTLRGVKQLLKNGNFDSETEAKFEIISRLQAIRKELTSIKEALSESSTTKE